MTERADGAPEIRLTDLAKHFRDVKAVDDVSLDIKAGEFFSLLGPSGCGKTTTLRMIGGFELPTTGRIELRGRDVTNDPPDKRPVNMVFQNYALFPHLNVGDNIAFGLRRKNVEKDQITRRVHEALELVHLTGLDKRKPNQLSGGQQQRVALARALVNRPNVLLLDEPLGALDLKLRRQMQDELKAIQKRVGTAFVHVTHDQEEAMALADHCVVMNDGRIEDAGPAERVYMRPATRFAAGFMGESTLVSATVAEGSEAIETGLGRLPLRTTQPAGTKVTLAIRPEHLALGAADRCDIAFGEATVAEIVFQGSFKRVLAVSRVDPSIRFIARAPATATLQPGDSVDISCQAHDVILLAT